MKLRLLSLAEADLLSGFQFYERQEQGVGSYFLESLNSDIESLHLFAGIHRRAHGYHRLLSRRFPFAVYYDLAGDEIRVWRVLDCRRPNKALEPTPLRVTPPACAGVAPLRVVARL